MKIYMPIEVASRELEARTLLAFFSARSSFDVVLGRKHMFLTCPENMFLTCPVEFHVLYYIITFCFALFLYNMFLLIVLSLSLSLSVHRKLFS